MQVTIQEHISRTRLLGFWDWLELYVLYQTANGKTEYRPVLLKSAPLYLLL